MRKGIFCTLFSTTLLSGMVVVQAQAENPWFNGITEPINDVTLSAPVVGIVSNRPITEGASVKKGQVAVELDHKLEELDMRRKKIVRDAAEVEFKRMKDLAQRSAISVSKEEMDKKDSEFQVANMDFELGKEQLQKRLLIAPFDGAIAEIFLKVGEACEARQAVVRIVDTKRCYFVSNIEARAAYNIKDGTKVVLQVEAGTNSVSLNGTISFVSPVVDPASGLLKIKAIFDNQDGQIRPGVAAKMQIKES